MTNQELIAYADGIMKEMVGKINRHRKNWVYIYKIEKIPHNGVQITMSIRFSQIIIHKDNVKIKESNVINFGTGKFYAIQDNEIMKWSIRRFFHWYFTDPIPSMTNPKKCSLLAQGKKCEYCSGRKIVINNEGKDV